MKLHSVLAICGSLLCSTLFAQSIYETQFGLGVSNVFGNDLTGLSNQPGYVLTGFDEVMGNANCYKQDIMAMKVDPGGHQDWVQVYETEDKDYAVSIDETPAHGFVMAGYRQEVSSCNWGGVSVQLLVTDDHGNVDWFKHYQIKNAANQQLGLEPINAIATHDDGYVVLARCYDSSFGGNLTVVFKADYYGNVLWKKVLKSESETKVIETQDGGYVISLSQKETTPGGIIQYVSLLKLDHGGNVLWNKWLHDTTIPVSHNYYSLIDNQGLIETRDGGLMLLCYSGPHGSGNNYQHLLVKLDQSGTVDWAQQYDKDYRIWEIAEDENGNIHFCGNMLAMLTPGLFQSQFIGSVDAMGYPIFATGVGYTQTTASSTGELLDIARSEDGGIGHLGHILEYHPNSGTPSASNVFLIQSNTVGDVCGHPLPFSSHHLAIADQNRSPVFLSGYALSVHVQTHSNIQVFYPEKQQCSAWERRAVAEAATEGSGIGAEPAQSSLQLQAFPNPVNDQLTIALSETDVIPESIRVTDLYGRVVLESAPNQAGPWKIDMASLAPGVYSIVVHSVSKVLTQSIVKY